MHPTLRTDGSSRAQAVPLSSTKAPQSPLSIRAVKHTSTPFQKLEGTIDASDYYFRMSGAKPLSERAPRQIADNPLEALSQDQLQAHARCLIDAPRSFDTIRQLTNLAKNPGLDVGLRG